LNESVYKITKSDKFITFFIAEIDFQEKKMRYINAGHFPPILYQNNEVTLLKSGTTVIGAFDKLPFINEPKEQNEKLMAEIDKFKGTQAYVDDIAILTTKLN